MKIHKKFLFQLYKTLTYKLSPLLYKYKIFGLIHNFFISLLKPAYVLVMGKKLYLDKSDSLRLTLNPRIKDFELSLFKTYIKPGDFVLDIGANIGYCTIIFSQLVGNKGKVFAFEPSPYNLILLKKNIKVNKINNVVVIPKAVTNNNGIVNLYLSNSSQADHKIRLEPQKRSSIKVNSIRIDDFITYKIPQIDFIKMDIQGAEGDALKSMSKLINNNKKIFLYTEYTPQYLSEYGTKPSQFINNLVNFGFKIYDIDEFNNKITITNPALLKNKYLDPNGASKNLLCIKGKFND